jgi:hypothetical protein
MKKKLKTKFDIGDLIQLHYAVPTNIFGLEKEIKTIIGIITSIDRKNEQGFAYWINISDYHNTITRFVFRASNLKIISKRKKKV